jgi:endonuclease YncB( thermonuclease family)
MERGGMLVVKLLLRLMVVVVCLGTLPIAQAWAIESDGYPVDVVAVEDGDTILVKHDKTLEHIRLVDIECPKHDRPFGPESVKATESLCLRQTVVIEPQGHDNNGRVIARVLLLSGASLSTELMSMGFGFCPTNDSVLEKLEANARAERLGLWGRSDFVPRGDWPHSQNTIGKLLSSERGSN